MIEENKYFIFDSPITAQRYYLKQLKYFLLNPYFKICLNIFHPKKIEQKKYYSSICAIFKNEVYYLEEWIEFHKTIGIDHFYLYNNFSDDNYKEVLEHYIEENTVTFIDWPLKQGQMAAYADCTKKFSKETNWITYIDLDEFIVPNLKNNVNDVLRMFEKNRPVVIAYWRLFGTAGLIKRNKKKFIIEDFYLCWRKYTNIGKIFFNTAYDYADDLTVNENMHYHWARFNRNKLPAVNFFNKVIAFGINRATSDLPPIQINHYFTKSYDEYIKKSARGDAFFEVNPRDEEYFYEHDSKCCSTDYSAYKYLVKLKLKIGKGE